VEVRPRTRQSQTRSTIPRQAGCCLCNPTPPARLWSPVPGWRCPRGWSVSRRKSWTGRRTEGAPLAGSRGHSMSFERWRPRTLRCLATLQSSFDARDVMLYDVYHSRCSLFVPFRIDRVNAILHNPGSLKMCLTEPSIVPCHSPQVRSATTISYHLLHKP
jgi:hypothetical protein